MEIVFASAVIVALWGGSIYAAVVYTRKALEAAREVKLAESKPAKRKYVRKATPSKAKVVEAAMVPATGLTEGGQKALANGHAGHAVFE